MIFITCFPSNIFLYDRLKKIQLKTEKYFYLQIHDLTMKIRMFHVENATFL